MEGVLPMTIEDIIRASLQEMDPRHTPARELFAWLADRAAAQGENNDGLVGAYMREAYTAFGTLIKAIEPQGPACPHRNATVTLCTERGYSYTFTRGKLTEEREDDEAELSTRLLVWCPACHFEAEYQEWVKVPQT